MVQLPRLLRTCAAGAILLLLSAPLAAQEAPPAHAPPKLPKFTPIPRTFEGRFDHRNNTAIDVLQYMQCNSSSSKAAQSGMFGQLPQEALLVCVKTEKEWRGVIAVPARNAYGFEVRNQLAIRGTGIVTRESIDTATVSALARAQVRASKTPVRKNGQADFVSIPIVQNGFMELWFLPLQSNPNEAIVGGDSLIQMELDATREMGHFSKSPALRRIPLAATGKSFVIMSSEEELPLLSEVIVAHLSATRFPEVKIVTKKHELVLSAKTGKWVHSVRRSS